MLDLLLVQFILVQPVFVQSISSNPNLIGLGEMDWTKNFGWKQVGRKLGARVEIYQYVHVSVLWTYSTWTLSRTASEWNCWYLIDLSFGLRLESRKHLNEISSLYKYIYIYLYIYIYEYIVAVRYMKVLFNWDGARSLSQTLSSQQQFDRLHPDGIQERVLVE